MLRLKPALAKKTPTMIYTTTNSAKRMPNSTVTYSGDVYARHATKFPKYLHDGTWVLSTTGFTTRPFTTGGVCSNPS